MSASLSSPSLSAVKFANSTSRARNCRSWTFSRRPAAGNGAASTARRKLLQSIEGADRGLNSSGKRKQEIMAAVQELMELGSEQVTTGQDLTATWRLAWTTEKEVLFILKNSGWFGTKAGEVYQVINVGTEFLQNVITFPPDGAFVVSSSIEVASPQRVNFKFNKTRLDLSNGRSIPLPTFAQGWFESVYMDESIRISIDIRGDTQVSIRDGDAQVF